MISWRPAAQAAPLSAAVRRRLLRSSAPTISGAVVDAFVLRVVGESSDGDRADLLTWLGTICASYGDVAALRGTLLELPDALARTARELGGPPPAAAALDALADDVRRVVETSWRPLTRVADEPLDEIDARIDALVARLEARDPLTSEHSRAVAAWCARLGRRLGLDAAGITFLRRCGLLHDIGKVVTPLGVLNAPRALDEREWTMMRAHAAAGEAIVVKIPELRAFSPAVRSHHERLDGRGYPDRLTASAIPFMARVVAVADSFNAMIGRRPYRLPMAPSRALEELQAHRGTQFDPDIVSAMGVLIAGQKS